VWCFALCHILHDDGYIKPFVGKTSLWCTKCAKSWDATLMLVCNKCSRRWHMGCLTSSLKKTKEVLGPNSTIQTSLNGSFLFAIHAKVKHYHQNNVFSGSYPILLGNTNNIGISRDFTYEGWSWTHHHPLWWF